MLAVGREAQKISGYASMAVAALAKTTPEVAINSASVSPKSTQRTKRWTGKG
jgi:hypothetical protein